SIVEPTLEGSTPEAAFAFNRRIDQLEGKVSAANKRIKAGLERVAAVRDVLLVTADADPALGARAYEIGKELKGLSEQLGGNETRAMANDQGPVAVGARLFHAGIGRYLSTYGPTQGHEQSLAIAEDEFRAVGQRLGQLLDEDLAKIEAALDKAGAPWTPGRSVSF
ncbi:MAG: hypothetical protein AAFX85_02480, partial [Pseudomonadota bacterium]